MFEWFFFQFTFQMSWGNNVVGMYQLFWNTLVKSVMNICILEPGSMEDEEAVQPVVIDNAPPPHHTECWRGGKCTCIGVSAINTVLLMVWSNWNSFIAARFIRPLRHIWWSVPLLHLNWWYFIIVPHVSQFEANWGLLFYPGIIALKL